VAVVDDIRVQIWIGWGGGPNWIGDPEAIQQISLTHSCTTRPRRD